ncbi:MAG TPA: bacillithiol biosynthesis deacetylase BshB1 [Bacteroidia bacterium]|nr:bacillithiol biosynthesis deacetylase BshB1 [Bacteroidia bacterium]
MKLDILAFGAHPDDVELSCSGVILKNTALGRKVGLIDLTKGELGTRGTPAIREKEAKASAKILGVLFRENLKMADGFFMNDKKHLLKVIQKIRQYRPDVVLANALEDRHPDHGRAAKLIADACFLSGLVKIITNQNGKSQEAWRPKAVYHYIQYRKLKADIAVDITPFIEKKMESIYAFSSQFYNPDSKEPSTLISQKDFFEYIKIREREYGQLIGVEYAEGFNVMQEYRGDVLI